MQSRENGQKPQFGQCFDDFEVKYLQIANFSENRFHSNLRSYLVLTSGEKQKNLRESFLRKIWKCLIWANLDTFFPISPNQEVFFKNQGL